MVAKQRYINIGEPRFNIRGFMRTHEELLVILDRIWATKLDYPEDTNSALILEAKLRNLEGVVKRARKLTGSLIEEYKYM